MLDSHLLSTSDSLASSVKTAAENDYSQPILKSQSILPLLMKSSVDFSATSGPSWDGGGGCWNVGWTCGMG